MRRLGCFVVIGSLAATASAVVAGPAVAAKGGNSDNAHVCQQGGHQNQVAADHPELAFKNAGDCASHGAQGGALSSLQVLPDTYQCLGSTGTCWGTVSGSGLRDGWNATNADTGVPFRFGEVDATGSVSQPLNLGCGGEISSVQAFSETSAGKTIVSPTVDAPTPCG